METIQIALFKGNKIRKTLHDNEWWFVIVDVVAALTDSAQPDGYIKDMRRRDPELANGWVSLWYQVPMIRFSGFYQDDPVRPADIDFTNLFDVCVLGGSMLSSRHETNSSIFPVRSALRLRLFRKAELVGSGDNAANANERNGAQHERTRTDVNPDGRLFTNRTYAT